MIGLLTGTPLLLETTLIIDVHGVGYAVTASTKTLQLCSNKDTVTLHISTYVKEDVLELFGFTSAQDKKLFLLLRTVSGIGPKTALAISDKGAQAITSAVQEADLKFFSTVPRVGKKLAQKIIIELTSKLGSLKELDLQPLSSFETELAQALGALGFSEQEATELIREGSFTATTVEGALKEILKNVGTRTKW